MEIEFLIFLEETLVDTVKPVEFMLPQRDSSGRVTEIKKSLKGVLGIFPSKVT
ncbi:hypothetical protein [Pseudoalteromonas sp. TB6-MNA-CIBAN-0076]|uniref:hypothetical protein n=1 Tax=Pseudoalteromonas sp. TB6-MNA-CIBAN-0076 TaxID=3140436 RepID=UPI00332BC91A